MTVIAFGEYSPDTSDYLTPNAAFLSNVVPRADGYGPVKALGSFSSALPAACRGEFFARNTDGTITVFAATSNRIFKMDNTTLGWVPVSKVVALTSISNGSPAVFTLAAHGLSNGDALVLSTTNTLPTGLTVGTIYYVINKAADTFNVSTSVGGTAVNTSGAGVGTHSMTYFYSSVPTTDNWQFAQDGNVVMAVQANVNPQAFTLGTSTAFADLGGSPPAARYIAIVGRIVVLTGLTNNPTRIHNSDIDTTTTWSAGTGYANTVDLPDGGVVRGVAGGEFGLVFQESALRKLTFIPGQKPAFQIERVSDELGLLGPYSVIRASDKIFFYSSKGFMKYEERSGFTPIGKERVDRTIAAELDVGNLQLFIGAADPAGTRVFWGYKTLSNPASTFDKMVCYDYALDRWSPITQTGEYLATLVKPGITLDGLDSSSPSIDAMGFSLDSVSSAVSASLSGFNSIHQLGLFDGSNLEAIMETPEQALNDSYRVFIRGLRPITDANSIYCSLRHRPRPFDSLSSSSETAVNANGICPQRVDTRYARGRTRIPAAVTWTFSRGIEPDFAPSGQR